MALRQPDKGNLVNKTPEAVPPAQSDVVAPRPDASAAREGGDASKSVAAPKVEAKKPDPALREPGTRKTDPTGTPVVPGPSDVVAPRPDASAASDDEGGDDDNGDTDDEGNEREEEEEPEEVDADEVHPADDLNDLAASVAAPPRTPSASAPPAPPPEPATAVRPPTLPTRTPVVEPAPAPKPVVAFDPTKRFCNECGRDVTGLKFCPDDGIPVPQPGQIATAARAPTPVSSPAPVVAPTFHAAPPAPRPAAEQFVWKYVDSRGDQQGPHSLKQMELFIKGRIIHEDTPVWRHPMPDWTSVKTVPELACFLPPPVGTPPSPPPPPAPIPASHAPYAPPDVRPAAPSVPKPTPPTYQRYCFKCAKDNGPGSTNKFCTGCGTERRVQAP